LDRFTLQANCDTVHRDRFSDVIRVGTRKEVADPSLMDGATTVAGADAVANTGDASSADFINAADSCGLADVTGGDDWKVGTDVNSRQPTDVGGGSRDFNLASHCVRSRMVKSTQGGSDEMDFTHEPGYANFERLVRRLGREDRVYVSDRKLIKLFKLLSAEAWLQGEPQLARSTFHLLAYIGNTADEMQILADKVPLLIDQL
jgi:hypothetical protein